MEASQHTHTSLFWKKITKSSNKKGSEVQDSVKINIT